MTTTEKRLLKLKDVLSICAISRSAAYRLMSERKFPLPVDSGAGPRWTVESVEGWINRLKQKKA